MQGQLATAGALGAAALRAPRRCERRRAAPPPCALFGGLFGGKKPDAAPRADTPAADMPPGAAGILEGTVLEGQPLQLSYDAARDGWTARAFHRCCDNKARAGARLRALYHRDPRLRLRLALALR